MTISGWVAYTIYYSPSDHPGRYVIRKFVLTGDGYCVPTTDVREALTLEEARSYVPFGLICFHRDERDLPSVVESWL